MMGIVFLDAVFTHEFGKGKQFELSFLIEKSFAVEEICQLGGDIFIDHGLNQVIVVNRQLQPSVR
jgi:hypothetical protein